MPCRVELSDAEIHAANEAARNRAIAEALKPYQKRNDELTHENDQLREIILRIATKDDVPAALWKKIQKTQIEHREEDLRRLEATFLEQAKQVRNSTEAITVLRRLEKVQNADPKKPLEPQLGFDPDAF